MTIDTETGEVLDGAGRELPALMQISKAEVDVQIATAKRYPRNIAKFRQDCLAMATVDQETAAGCFYAIPRAGKTIEGPSIRLAEIVGSAWGNIRYGTRVVETEQRWVTAQGVAYDLEKNVWVTVEVRRRITDSGGRRYNDDMINVTAQAAMSIALRNAIFRVVPLVYVKEVYEEAKAVAVGKGLDLSTQRKNALVWFSRVGATEAELLKLLGRAAMADVDYDDIVALRGLRTAIHDGETTWQDVRRGIDAPTGEGAEKAPIDALADALRQRREGGAPATSGAPTDAPAKEAPQSAPEQPQKQIVPAATASTASTATAAIAIATPAAAVASPAKATPEAAKVAPVEESEPEGIPLDEERVKLFSEITSEAEARNFKESVVEYLCERTTRKRDMAQVPTDGLRKVLAEIQKQPKPKGKK